MKIDDKIISYEVTGNIRKLSPGGAERLEKEKLSSEKQVSDQQPLEGDAIVHLSQAGREAKALKEFLVTLPDMRNEKVSLLREKIETGTYEVDYAGVAGKLVDAFIEDLL
jgi:flagellar biosynthesis anti-sigma factor FlgM